MVARPRRSVLYMPGSNAKAIAKARGLPADAVILDLEDSVAPDAKVAARAQVVQAVREGGFGAREVVVRVNGAHTPWGEADLAAAISAAPDAILLPKIDGPGGIMLAARALSDARAPEKTRLWAMMETPMAILSAGSIAATAADPDRAPGSAGDGPQRPGQGDARAAHPGRAAFSTWLATLRRGGARARLRHSRRRLQRHRRPRRLPRRMRTGPRNGPRRQDADPSRARSISATRFSRRARPRWIARARSSKPSRCPRTPARA